MEFINLKKQYEGVKEDINASIQKIMEEARFIGGIEVQELENKLASYVGRKHCISCGNGTDALMLAYLAYGIRSGDAVFCPDMTFIASIEPACMLGATPIFCDIDRKSYNISPTSLEEKINEVLEKGTLSPKAVVMVDFLGNPADFDAIDAICKKYNLILIEDAAQAIGAIYKGNKCGSFGDISCTSFFPSKPLGCYGDGGAIFTDNDDIADLIKSYKVHGKGSSKYDNIRIGMNSRLDTIQAAVLLAKMKVLDFEMEKRQVIAKRYNEAFKDILQIPEIDEFNQSAYAQYCLLAKNEDERTKIIEAMKINNIPSLIYYPKEIHKMNAFDVRNEEKFENTSIYAKCNFGVPFSPYLTEEEQELVISTITSVLK